MSWRQVWLKKIEQMKHYYRYRRFNRAELASRLVFFLLALGIGSILFLLIIFAIYAKDLPRPDKIVRKEGFATKIYDRNNELLYDVFANQRRTPVSFSDIPDHLKNATIAVEDKNFYKHKGFDPRGILRALWSIVVNRRLQGGSTLTQQLVKNVLLTSQRNLPRKIKEFILAIQIESRYSKDEILLMYLNEAPYGGTAWGVETASQLYFGKKVAELNLVESAFLAGLPQRPSAYSPFSDNNQAYIGRTQHVLRRMQEDEYITREQEEEAKKQLESLTFNQEGSDFKAPHFVMYVKKKLEERYGQQMVEQGGLRVYTTLDFNLQKASQEIVAEEIKKVEAGYHITNGAAIVIDPKTGEILAMVGSKDYNDPNYDGKVNVTLSLRQPGSAIKPVTYLTAFKKGYTASTMIMDAPVTFLVTSQPDYKPVNYDGKFRGPLQIRYALGNSINVVAVKMLAKVGLKEFLQTASDLGIATLEPSEENLKRLGLSVTLGGGEVRLLELANAYSVFANGGFKVDSTVILKVTDKDGNIIDEYKPLEGKRVISPEQAFLISHILADNNARLLTFGERSALVVPERTVAVKTGTTNDRRDNWTIGWTPQIMVGVWVGNNDNTPMKQLVSGVAGAAPIWRRIIQKTLANKPNLDFGVPEGMISAEVDTVSGFKAHDNFPARTEYFIKGTEPTGEDPIHAKIKLCREQLDKLATPLQIARGDYDEKEYFVFEEEDPISPDNINRWQEGINEWLNTQQDSRFHPPTDFCGEQQDLAVVIQEPNNHAQVEATNKEVKVKAEIIANQKVTKVYFFINGEQKEQLEKGPYERIFTLADGPYTIKVKAEDETGKQAEAEVKIGVNVPWDWQPVTPTPSPTTSPTPIFTLTPTLTP